MIPKVLIVVRNFCTVNTHTCACWCSPEHSAVLFRCVLPKCVFIQKNKRAYVERPSHATQREGIFGVTDGDYEEYYFIRLENG